MKHDKEILMHTVTAFFFVLLAVGAIVAILMISKNAPPIIQSNEGQAKAYMIKELTGMELPPDVAKWATVTFSGTSVSIDTERLNIWLGKNWESKK